MEWNQLQYFQAVAQLEHFTRASETLSVSQPTLSRAIARLEKEIGVPLFDREGRTVSLNRYGQIFLNRVNRGMQEITDGIEEIQKLVDCSDGSISLGFLPSQGSSLVPDLLRLFRKDYPTIRFQLYQNITNNILDQLESSKLDFCICTEPFSHKNVKWIPLSTEELFVIVPKEHPLAQKSIIKLKDLAEESFITFKRELTLAEMTDRFFREAGFIPKVTFEGEEVGTIAGLVAANLGIALIPHSKGLDMTEIAQLQISEPVCQRIIGLAWIKNRYMSPAALRFQEFVQNIHYDLTPH